MKVLHRSAITVSYKKPFVDLNNRLFPELQMDENMLGESKTYLIDNLNDNAEEVIKKYYKIIFETELEGVSIDKNEWPKKLSVKLFNEWFNYEISDWVMDLSKKRILDINT